MSTDASRGFVEFFEDFVGTDVVADKPEYGVDTDPAVQVVSGGVNGVVRITMDAGQSNVGGILFGQTQWNVVDNGIYVEARVKLSALGTAEERVGIWLTDLQEDTLSEYPFTMEGGTTTAVADPNDAIGIFWEGDTTTPSFYALSQNTDVLVVDGLANQTVHVAPVAGQWHTLSFSVAPGGKSAEFSVDGKLIYRYDGSTAVVGDVAMIPVFGATEGTMAINADLDYLYVRSARE